MSYIVPKIEKYTAGENLTVDDVVEIINNQAYKVTESANYGNLLTLTASNTAGAIVIKINTNKFIFIFADSTNSNYGTAVVLTLSGRNLVAGSPTIFNSSATTYISACKVENDKVFVIYYNGSQNTSKILTISDTTVDFGLAVSPSVDFITVPYNSCTLISDNAVQVAYRVTNSYGRTACCSINGTVITYGIEQTFESVIITTAIKIEKIDTNKAIIIFSSDGNFNCHITTTTGTEITLGTTRRLITSRTADYINVNKITTDKLLIAYRNITNTIGDTFILNITGNNVTMGNVFTFKSENVAYINLNDYCGKTNYKLLTFRSSVTPFYLYHIILKITNDTVTADKEVKNMFYNFPNTFVAEDNYGKYVMIGQMTGYKSYCFEIGKMIKAEQLSGICKKTTTSGNQAPIAIFPTTTT